MYSNDFKFDKFESTVTKSSNSACAFTSFFSRISLNWNNAIAFGNLIGSDTSPGDNAKIMGFIISGNVSKFCHFIRPPTLAVGASECFRAALENSSIALMFFSRLAILSFSLISFQDYILVIYLKCKKTFYYKLMKHNNLL